MLAMPAPVEAKAAGAAAETGTLQHCDDGRELVVLPGRLECLLPWLLHAASWLPPFARQQEYNFGVGRVTSRLARGDGPPEFTLFLEPPPPPPPLPTQVLTDSLSEENVWPPPPPLPTWSCW